jgi:hypothetical protein
LDHVVAGQPQAVGRSGHAGQVLGVVRPAERGGQLAVAVRGLQPEAPLPAGRGPEEHGEKVGVGVLKAGKAHGRVHQFQGRVPEQGVVPADHGAAALPQVAQEGGLGARHARLVAEPFQVAGTHVGDDRQVRAGHRGQLLHVAAPGDAELHNPQLLVGRGLEHGRGQPDLVVEVAVVLGRGEFSRGHGVEHLLDRGLARRAGHGHELRPAGVAPAGGQPAQGGLGIADHDHRGVGLFDHARGHHGARTARGGLGREFVAVEILARDAEKEIAGLHGAGVRLHLGDHGLLESLVGQGAEAAGDFSQGQVHEYTSSMAVSAASLSEKWRLVVPMIW